MFSRHLILIYGVIAYAIGLGGMVYFILFLEDWNILPRHINSDAAGPVGRAVLINLGLMLVFGGQHTVMARRRFKQIWTRVIPSSAERSTYVLLSGLVLYLIALYWQTLPGSLWHVQSPTLWAALIALQLSGWIMVVVASGTINHFELFGLQQVYYNYVGKPEPGPHFTDRFLYRVVRHPLQLGVLIGIWSTPRMTTTHLMLSATMTLYIFIGLYYEERDLLASLGSDYEEYRRRVPMILPFPKSS